MPLPLNNQIEPSNYLDLSDLDKLRQQAKSADGQKTALLKAAQQFEAIFTKMLLTTMRQANEAFEDPDNPFNSQSTKFYEQMHDDQLAQELSSSGSLGLAEIIVQQLSPEGTNVTPAGLWRPDPLAQGALGKTIASDNPGFSIGQDNVGLAFDRHTFTSPRAKPGLAIDGNNPLPVSTSTRSASEELADTASTALPTALAYQQVAERNSKFSPAGQSHEPAISGHAATPAGQANELSEAEQRAVRQQQDSWFANAEQFVAGIWQKSQAVAKQLQLNPAVLIAQAALETGWGSKVVRDSQGNNSFNLFNIKADSQWSGPKTSKLTLEYEQGVAVQKRAAFRRYDSVEQSLADYQNFLNKPRYAKALANAEKPEQYLQELQNAGYATDPNYANKIMTILRSPALQQAINQAASQTTSATE